eukprot:1387510-Alexandrium_andersonii.AAC.1
MISALTRWPRLRGFVERPAHRQRRQLFARPDPRIVTEEGKRQHLGPIWLEECRAVSGLAAAGQKSI